MDAGLDSLPVDSEWVELLWLLGEAAMLLDERDAAHAVHNALEPYAELWAVDGYGGACFGQVSDLLARLRSTTTARRPRLPAERHSYGLARSGDWSSAAGPPQWSTPRACVIWRAADPAGS